MKTSALSAIVILTVMGVAHLIATAGPKEDASLSRKDQQEEFDKKVKELQKERIATLKTLADEVTAAHRQGTANFDDMYEARLLFLKAEAEAAEKESDRIKVYQQIVDVTKVLEQEAGAFYQSGRGKYSTVLKMKARRLKAEITLTQAKAKATK